MNDLWSATRALLARATGHLRRPGEGAPARSAFALVIRLENVDLLGGYLGQAGFAHLLVQMSLRMTRVVRPHDPVQVAAPGLFSVGLETRSPIEAQRIALRLQAECQGMFSVGGMAVQPVLTGMLVRNDPARPAQRAALVSAARAALDAASPDAVGRILMTDYAGRDSGPGLVVPATVSDAVADNQIEAYFQPQVCCHTGAVTGFEALARWNHPRRGVLQPGAFMPGMRDGDHSALTASIMRQGLRALAHWDAAGFDVPTVSVNLDQAELSDPGFADSVLWELDRQNTSPARLVLEVLESVGPINSCPNARGNLRRLAAAGCRLDLDDFGTGYANLGSIRDFGVHRLKIDRSFVTDCHRDPAQQKMILAILALAERLGLDTLAEGVERSEEHAFLAQIGCDQVQGFAVAPPMPLPQVATFLNQYRRDQPALPEMMRKAG